jgi:hypothetical protein
MRIGIEINGVLRDTIGKFKQLYEQHLIDKNDVESIDKTYSLEFSGDTEDAILLEETNESDWFKYEVLSEVNSLDLESHFAFPSKDDLYTFMYEDYTMELFGHSPSTETLTFNYLNDMYLNLRDNNDLLIVSDEIGKSKPSSLFFLSKFVCEFEKIKFYSNSTINSMWNEIDVLLTANPSLLLDYPSDKTLIKYNTDYNKNVTSEYEINKIKELEEVIKNLK